MHHRPTQLLPPGLLLGDSMPSPLPPWALPWGRPKDKSCPARHAHPYPTPCRAVAPHKHDEAGQGGGGGYQKSTKMPPNRYQERADTQIRPRTSSGRLYIWKSSRSTALADVMLHRAAGEWADFHLGAECPHTLHLIPGERALGSEVEVRPLASSMV